MSEEIKKEFRLYLEQEILPLLDTLDSKNRNVLRNIIRFEQEAVVMGELSSKLKEYGVIVDLPKIVARYKEKKEIKNIFTKTKEEDIIETSSLVTEDFIVEQIYNNQSQFAVYNRNNGEIQYVSAFLGSKPIIAEEILKGAILLPTKAEEYISDEALDEELKLFIEKWLDVPSVYIKFAILNIKKSWLYDRFYNLNYLRALGDTGSGKSRFLKTLGFLHYKPINVSGALTSAVVFRLIDKWKGTLIIDEADFRKTDASEDIIKIINQGYEKGNFVARCNKEDKNRVEFFDVYCPKILATRRAFYDKAVESRCMTQVMQETQRKDIPPELNDKFFEDLLKLRNKLLMYRFKNYDLIDLSISERIDLGFLEPRLRQVNEGYLALFQHSEENLEEFIDFLREYQKEIIAERQNTIEGAIVTGLYSLLTNEDGNIDFEKDITAKDILQSNEDELKDITARKVSGVLKSFGFEKGKMSRKGGKVRRIIQLNKDLLLPLFKRYGCNDVTDVTVVTHTEEKKKKEEKRGFDWG